MCDVFRCNKAVVEVGKEAIVMWDVFRCNKAVVEVGKEAIVMCDVFRCNKAGLQNIITHSWLPHNALHSPS